MKFLGLIFVAAAVVQADRDWTKIRQKDFRVDSLIPPIFNPKIVGGETAERHQFPHQVALFIDGDSFCGGSIVRENAILTAAHCVEGARSVEVVAGAHNIQEPESTQQSITSSNIIVHEDWDKSNLINDIALVILPQKFNLDGVTAKAISIRQAICPESYLDYVTGAISGWGQTTDSSSISPVLQYASNMIIHNSRCSAYFDDSIKDTHVCFYGAFRKGACNGDFGGPLTVVAGDGIELVGIASFVHMWGCETYYPTVYTRVSCFAEWIESKIY